MKILLITDTHYGVKSDSLLVHDTFKKYWSDFVIPLCKEHNIKELIHLGDVFDKQKYTTGLTLKRFKEDFVDPIKGANLNCVFLIGNHDCYYKNTLNPNYVDKFIKPLGFQVVNEAITIAYENVKIDFLPWICQSNYESTMKFIKESSSPILVGHLELAGFQMYKTHKAKEGMSPKIFDKYHMVCSGHYHSKSSNGNINYLGSALDFTWADWDDPKGVHILDTETLQLTFIPNPIDIHTKIFYNKDFNLTDSLLKSEGRIVKFVSDEIVDRHEYDKIVNQLESVAASITLEDNSVSFTDQYNSDIDLKIEDTLSIFKSYIKVDDIDLDHLITEIYEEAITLS